MLSLSIPEFNTPELHKLVRSRLHSLGYSNESLQSIDVQLKWDWMAGATSGHGALHIQVHGMTLAQVSIDSFTSNCGVRALHALKIADWCEKHVGALFMTIIDDLLIHHGYSAIVGSDGESSAAKLIEYIQKWGKKYEVIKIGPNHRQSSKPLYLYWKHIGHKQTLNLPWSDAVNA